MEILASKNVLYLNFFKNFEKLEKIHKKEWRIIKNYYLIKK